MKNSSSRILEALPGLSVAAAIAAVATLIGHQFPILGSAMPAIVIGVAFAILGRKPESLTPGLRFASKMVLQIAVVILGTQLSLRQVAEVGAESFPIMISTLTVCLLAAWLLGKAMRIDSDLNVLIGVGTAICGASAIAAVSPVVKARNEAIAYAVSTIFLFNVMAVVIFPPLGRLLGLTQHEFGLFAGTAVNDTSSVVATAGIYGSAALGFAVVVKLVRTLMIIPISLGLAVMEARKEADREGETADSAGGRAGISVAGALKLIPWFLIGFLLASVLRSVGVVPDAAQAPLASVAMFFIATAMAAIGLSTDVAGFRKAGIRPLLLGGLLWIIVTATALGAIFLMR
ncbi:putative sulfate exporter family transporter [Actinomycetaceae bacterium L2_0104]